LRQSLGVAAALGALVAVLALMIQHALHGGDWPGWDEGWVLVVFPLGISGSVAAAVRVRPSALADVTWPRIAFITGAVWLWGAVLFLVWLAIG
jgi:hypothetical protein